MPRYFLPCPKCNKGTLRQKGFIADCSATIYHCHADNSFWALMFTPGLNVALMPNDVKTGKIDKKKPKPVPDDWEGDPNNIGVPFEVWQDIHHSSATGSMVGEVPASLKSLIEGGNFLYLLGEDGKPTHRIVVEHGTLALKPLVL